MYNFKCVRSHIKKKKKGRRGKGKTNMNDFKVFSEYEMSHRVVITLYGDRWLLDLSW